MKFIALSKTPSRACNKSQFFAGTVSPNAVMSTSTIAAGDQSVWLARKKSAVRTFAENDERRRSRDASFNDRLVVDY